MSNLKTYLSRQRSYLFIYLSVLMLILFVIGQWFGFSLTKSLLVFIFTLLAVFSLIEWPEAPSTKLKLFFIICLAAFITESLLPKTFGSYLSFKLFGTPLMIGLIWLIEILAVWQMISLARLKSAQRLIIIGLTVVMFDLTMNNMALTYDLWHITTIRNQALSLLVKTVVLTLIIEIISQKLPVKKISPYLVSILVIIAVFFWLMLLVS